MRFRFRLEPVLRLREREEAARRRDVAELEHKRLALEERIRACQERIRGSKAAVRAGLAGPLDLGALRGEAAGSIGAMRQAQVLVRELAAVHGNLETARAALREASKARRAVELLRERRLESWQRDVARSEQRDLDEIASREE